MDNASFEYYDKIMKALLKLVRENEGIGSLEIRRAMCHKGLREDTSNSTWMKPAGEG